MKNKNIERKAEVSVMLLLLVLFECKSALEIPKNQRNDANCIKLSAENRIKLDAI